MTQEQRIKSLENQVMNLKDEIKRNKKANVWKEVKEKFIQEFNSFNWVNEHKMVKCDGETVTFKHNMDESYHISQAIGTIVRITLKRKGIVYLEEKDIEKAERITRQILEIMKKEKEGNQ